jgi:hypothetical protein
MTTNYEGQRYINWLQSDSQNVQQLGTNFFRGGYNTDTPEQAILDTEDDLLNIKKINLTYKAEELEPSELEQTTNQNNQGL